MEMLDYLPEAFELVIAEIIWQQNKTECATLSAEVFELVIAEIIWQQNKTDYATLSAGEQEE
ncbi:MAG: hypothetical protein K5773_03525 [Pseudobutyrivibrio sp.]|nr:hypothetical protein [Pseudobutyrivibrio sp.]